MSTDPGTKFQEFKLPLLLAHSHDLWEAPYPFHASVYSPCTKGRRRRRASRTRPVPRCWGAGGGERFLHLVKLVGMEGKHLRLSEGEAADL